MKNKDEISILPTWPKKNAERLARCETALAPNTPENREKWNTAQVNNHESLFSFSDHLTTLMFFVASDLSEAQGERESPSLYGEWNSPLTPLKLREQCS